MEDLILIEELGELRVAIGAVIRKRGTKEAAAKLDAPHPNHLHSGSVMLQGIS